MECEILPNSHTKLFIIDKFFNKEIVKSILLLYSVFSFIDRISVSNYNL